MKCGFFKQDITPPAGLYMEGKAHKRIAQNVVDPLNVRAIAFEDNDLAVVLIFDLCGMLQGQCNIIRDYVAKN